MMELRPASNSGWEPVAFEATREVHDSILAISAWKRGEFQVVSMLKPMQEEYVQVLIVRGHYSPQEAADILEEFGMFRFRIVNSRSHECGCAEVATFEAPTGVAQA